jgi:hypothetical protein
MSFTTATLLDKIKRAAAVPTSSSTFDDPEILEMADDAIQGDILPDMLKSRQEFFVTWEDLTPTDGDPYPYIRVPERAVGRSIIGVYDPDDDYEEPPLSYYVEGDKIYFADNSLDVRRIRYYIRPAKLVEVSSCATITSITNNGATTDIVVGSVPQDYVSNLKYDIVRGKAGFDLLKKDISLSIVGTTFTVDTADVPSEIQVGDYVCIADTTPVPQIPVEWFTYLANHTAALILESIGDMDAAAKIEKKLPAMRKNALSLISPRVEKRGKPIM